MPKGYQHLTYEQRCQIYALLKKGFTQKLIAKDINVDQSAISREIKRNKGKRGYRYQQAQRKASTRRKNASSGCKKMTPELTLLVEYLICEKQWSPEQISGYLKKQKKILISHERIYQYIWKNKREKGTLYKHLRHGGKKYNKRRNKTAGRGLIPNRVGIEMRPEIVDKKGRIGDFEIDTIVGAKHRGAIVSLVERKTMITKLKLIPNSTAKEASRATIDMLKPIEKHVHSITADNGKEFAKHEFISQELKVNFYFANPYHAWERGLNENINGLVRQYLPKGTDFTTITHEQVRQIEYLLNNRPRKSLKFRTPNEAFLRSTGVDLNYALRG